MLWKDRDIALQELHEGHPGITKLLLETVHWHCRSHLRDDAGC